MSVELMPGTRLSPQVHLAMVAEQLDGVKGLIVLKVDEHGAVDVSMSCLSLSDVAYASLILHLHAADLAKGTPPEGATMHPKDSA